MLIPARLLRAQLDDLPDGRPTLTGRQQEQKNRIRRAATSLIGRWGRGRISFTAFAVALRMAPSTVRFHFVDLDCIVYDLLERHLLAVAGAISRIPSDTPNLLAARRAAYIAGTQNGLGASTETHLLLLRDRHSLPEDLREGIEELRCSIGQSLAGAADPATVLALLDIPGMLPEKTQALVATLEATTPAIAPTELEPQPEAPPPVRLPQPTPQYVQYMNGSPANHIAKTLLHHHTALGSHPKPN